MKSIFELWDAVVVSGAVIAIAGIALGLMTRVIEPPNALRRIGATLGCMVILTMVPPIFLHLLGTLSLWQRFVIVALVGLGSAVAWERYHDRPRKGSGNH